MRLDILRQVAELFSGGDEIILIHGGGKSLHRRLQQLGMTSRFVNGLRVTDEETLQVAIMVLAGEVNKTIVVDYGKVGGRALGLCGADGCAVRCAPIAESPDLGFVGRPVSVQRNVFELLLANGLLPVVSSLALGPEDQVYNINADQMASVCASGTGCEALIYLTDVPGVLDSEQRVCGSLSCGDVEDMRKSGLIRGGMLPKTEACVQALRAGVQSVYILPGASAGVLHRFMSGRLEEGTTIHADG